MVGKPAAVHKPLTSLRQQALPLVVFRLIFVAVSGNNRYHPAS
jgi:hypothetical protein